MANEGVGTPNFVPNPNPSTLSWGFVDSPLSFSSSYVASTQTLATFGGHWSMSAVWRSFEKKDLLPIVATLNYYGVSRTFTTFVFDQRGPIGNVATASTAALDLLKVNGASQTGFSISLKDNTGATNATLLETGDLIGFNGSGGVPQLFQLRANLTLASGVGAASLSQPIRTPASNNAQVFTRFVPVRVRQMAQPRINVSADGNEYEINAEFREQVNE